MANKVADRAKLDNVQAELVKTMDAAMQWAIDSPYPDPSRVTEDIYA